MTIQSVFRSTGVLISSKETFSELRRAMLSPKGWHHLAEISGTSKGTRKNFTLVKCPGGCSVSPPLLGPTIFILRTVPCGGDQDAWLGEWILRNAYPPAGLKCSAIFKGAVPFLLLPLVHSSRNLWSWEVLCSHFFLRNRRATKSGFDCVLLQLWGRLSFLPFPSF